MEINILKGAISRNIYRYNYKLKTRLEVNVVGRYFHGINHKGFFGLLSCVECRSGQNPKFMEQHNSIMEVHNSSYGARRLQFMELQIKIVGLN